ncbi:MAG: metal-dependent hydrolase [Calditrichaeota bacterium]|nr:metal-dependent hydrolase [Calditrichota bacterium]
MPKLTYIGHDAFLLEHDATRIVFDPFLSGNPLITTNPDELKVDYVLLTHGHGDHLGDGITIAQNNNATVVAPFELTTYCASQGCKVHPMHIGGAFHFPFGRVKLTIAHHGSGADLGGDALAYMGNPCGFLVTLDGKTVYHAGDTGIFLDMKLIGEMDEIDIALLPIGDNFTMGIDDAVKAAEFLQAKLTIPMHYNTFEVIEVDPLEFQKKISAIGLSSRVLEFGESLEF